MPKVKRKIFRYVTILVVMSVLASLYHAPNSTFVQRSVLKILSQGDLKFGVENLSFDLLASRVRARDINIVNEAKGRRFHFDKIDLKYSFFNLLMGKAVIKHLEITGAEAVLPQTASEEESTKKISLKKLFLLRNIAIDDAKVDQFKLTADKSELLVDTLLLQFKPRLTGDVVLKIDIQGATYNAGGDAMSFGNLSLDGKSKLNQWLNEPPYVNDINGGLHVKDLRLLRDLEIASFDSHIFIKNKRFDITDFKVIKEGKPLSGIFSVDMAHETYSADINIPEPIKFPTLGMDPNSEDEPTMDTQGEISGEFKAEGTGFSLENTTGKAEINLTHARTGLPSINVISTINWKKGVATLANSVAKIADGTINITGSVNVPGKKIDLKFDIDNVPTEAAFGRFYDDNFHPIFGPATGSATFKGWGKDFRVEGEASTIGTGGYYKIKTDRAHAKVNVTYQELTLIGEAESKGKQFGDIVLKIKFGPKVEGKIRPKTIHIDASAEDVPMDRCFEDYGLTGTGFGKMVMDGPPRSFSSKLSGGIINGSFAGIDFQKVAVNSDMTYKKIKFTDGEVVLPNAGPIPFASPIQMDFGVGSFRMYGKPIEHLSFDTTYTVVSDSWKISDIRYKDLTAKGTYSPKGSSDLTVDGTVNGEDLQIFKYYFRDIGGPFTAKLRLSGPTSDPSLNGRLEMKDNMLFPRALGQRMENVDGTLIFDGHTIRTEQLTGNIENGSFKLSGGIQHSKLSLAKSDLALEGRDLRYVSDDRGFRMEFDPKVTLKGARGDLMLSGDIDILDGRYTKDFSMLENLKGKTPSKKESTKELFSTKDVKVDLRIHNSGDLAIKNNIGTIWFKADIKATGPADKPKINGTIDSQDGKIRYLGKDFTITNGFLEFKDDPADPYIEVTAEHTAPSLPDTVVTTVLRGNVNNLSLELSSIPAMEKRDIISLLMFGATEQDLRNSQTSNQFSTQMVAAQVSGVIEQPLTKLTHLDVFRLEASGSAIDNDPQRARQSRNQPTTSQISRIYLGKQLTDRLSVSFVTDVGAENSQQTFRTEYLVTDFLLFKGISATGQYYQFNVSLRFKER